MRGLVVVLLGLAGLSALAAGKPGYPDKITWSGVTWDVKTSRSAVGPGPNLFDKANVSVDGVGNLHLRIAKNASGNWTCAEIIGPTSYGYGTYTFTLASQVDAFDPNGNPPAGGVYLHDGRARSITEAVLWHGGEALPMKNAFLQLPAEQRAQLLAYVAYPFADPLPLRRCSQGMGDTLMTQ